MLPKNLAASAERRTCVFCALSVLALLFGLGNDGLFISLSEDDLMNLRFGASEPIGRLLLANLFPFTTVYRPMGSAVYVAMFEAFAFHPIYYRAISYGILLLSCVALYQLAKTIDGRVTASSLAAILAAFHSRFLHIYSEGSYLYDILCGMFFLAAVLFYAAKRKRGPLSWGGIGVIYLLWAAAVNSKEIALTLPAVLLAYEAIFHWPEAKRNLATPLALFGLAVGAWRGKVAAGSALHGHQYYQASFEIEAILQSIQTQLADAVMSRSLALAPSVAVLLLVPICWQSLANRSKTAAFGLSWAMITPWPVLLIADRPFSAMYVPWMGVALALGALSADWIERRQFRPRTYPALVAAMAVLWGGLNLADAKTRPSIAEIGARWEHVRDAIDDYSKIDGICEARMMLVLDSRFGELYHPLFIAQLLCGDYDKVIHIAGLNISEEDAAAKRADYDLVIRDLGSDIEVIQRKGTVVAGCLLVTQCLHRIKTRRAPRRDESRAPGDTRQQQRRRPKRQRVSRRDLIQPTFEVLAEPIGRRHADDNTRCSQN